MKILHDKLAIVALTAVLGLGASGGVAFATQSTSADSGEHSSSLGQAASDTWITTKVKAELATTKGVESTDISVETKGGVVTLVGVLPSDTAVEKAVAAAKSVKGVKDVDDSGLKVK